MAHACRGSPKMREITIFKRTMNARLFITRHHRVSEQGGRACPGARADSSCRECSFLSRDLYRVMAGGTNSCRYRCLLLDDYALIDQICLKLHP